MANINKSFNFRNGVQVDNDNFVVNANGLVGIGTSIPREFLDVYGTAKITGLVTTTNLAVSGVSTFYSDLKVGSGITLSPSTGAVTAIAFYGNGLTLSNIVGYSTEAWIVNAARTGLSTTLNVGIGTTNPQYSFQVGQNPSSGNGFSVDGSTGNVKTAGIITANSFDGNGDSLTTLNATNIASGTLNNARLPSNINVGIVTATTFSGSLSGNVTGIASTALSLSGTPNITVGFVTATQLVGNVTGIASTALSLSGSPSITVTNINATNSGIITAVNLVSGISSVGVSTISTRLYAESIGVGTNSPASDVHIRRTSTSTLQLTSDSAEAIIAIGRSTSLTGNNGALRFGNTSGLYPYSSTKSLDIINYGTGNINNYLDFGTPGIGTGNFNWFYRSNPIMSLTYGGNLGIGFTNPTEKLRVAGVASISGSLFVDQDVKISQNANILGNLTVTGTATIGNFDIIINETSGISTFYDINVTNTAIVNTSIGIGNTNPLTPIHVGDYSQDPTNSVIISTSGVGIGTTALYDGCGIYGLGIDALLGVVSIGSSLTPDLPDDIRLSVKNGSTQLENVKVLGVTTSVNGFTSGIGITNPVKITVSANILTFTVAGVGVTSLRLY
jgi:hypothetical protein